MRLIELKLKDNSDESFSVCIHSAGNDVMCVCVCVCI